MYLKNPDLHSNANLGSSASDSWAGRGYLCIAVVIELCQSVHVPMRSNTKHSTPCSEAGVSIVVYVMSSSSNRCFVMLLD